MKNVLKKSSFMKTLKYLPLAILLYSCNNIGSQAIFLKPSEDKIININLGDNTKIYHEVNNTYNHVIEYTYKVEKGLVIAKDKNDKSPVYYAPFTGGIDNLKTVIFDKTSNVKIADISEKIYIKGESITYIDLVEPNKVLAEKENGNIKIASFLNPVLKKDVDTGRNPAISNGGKYIAYTKYSDNGTSQIILKDLTGKEINLTNDDSVNKEPTWSPNNNSGKTYIVFSSNRNPNNSNPDRKFHLWKIDVDTKELTQLTKDNCNDIQPDWSSLGTSIVFTSNLNKGNESEVYNIYTLDLETLERKQLTLEVNPKYSSSNPVWSPDSKMVAYTRKYQKRILQSTSDLQKIWMIDTTRNVQGFGQIMTRENDQSIIESFPSWSADGRAITFVQSRGSENSLMSQELNLGRAAVYSVFYNSPPLYENAPRNITDAKWARQRINTSYEAYLSNWFPVTN